VERRLVSFQIQALHMLPLHSCKRECTLDTRVHLNDIANGSDLVEARVRM